MQRFFDLSRLLLPAAGLLTAGCVSDLSEYPIVMGDETIIMEDGEIVERKPIISAPKSLRPITPPKEVEDIPAELGPPPKKLPMAKPLPAKPSSLKKIEDIEDIDEGEE